MKSYQRGWTLRRRVLALLGVVLVLLLGLAAAEAAIAAKNRQNIDAVLLRTGPLRVQAQELMSALLDQETAVRGYAVNADRKDLAPYADGLKREQGTVSEMRKLAADYPAVLRELAVVEQRADGWRTEVAQPVISATERGGPTAGQALITDQTRQRFDGIRAAVDKLQDEILAVRQQTAGKVNATSNLLVALLIIAALVVAVAGVVTLVSLDRILIRPLAGLVGQVREVVAGDYRHHIEGDGPPEFRRLADDIDAMRQKIARELDEVREARERIEWVNSQLQKQAEELTRSNRDLEQFAYVASHDLQEPLRKVASFCQLLQRRYSGQLDERADQYISFAVDGAQRMQRLINDLLAFSRIGRLTTGFTEVDLNKVMGDVAAQTDAARQYADAELTWENLPVIRGEEPLLTNLLANLVSNSIKFRRPDVPPRVHVSARLVEDEWEITCQDNGIGIEPEFADKIFVIFQRLHSKDAYPGTGIGLAIVKKIVEYHGGRVWVDTDAGEGTAIRFTLPALPGEPAATVDGEDGTLAATTGGMKETVG
ncbi:MULTISPECIES: ATP-binding protein [Micromonospora]|uniref:histidine kinase n=1 Tax=Micromonospora solifontis TaxID=2487138 RepID=A0ABX9WJV6_9ACTN|nr:MULTISPECIES: sensor histidine kinase [Micromonospora]NES12516.1 HAMP domain-containing protein [Micromonospora sp. PPF5-17B]NES36039.1 HAMP domain-containing protein [Micromonospora solifontis]NES54599.1 HAMP domain-containing protein [Micromonospora sp. PPF5-6]RNL99962.1 HAMP domain-containing protein [Micromonospora solifontis]